MILWSVWISIFTPILFLKKYMKTHTRVKSFSCEWCGSIFSAGSCLKIHMWTHIGKKPFSCELCGSTSSVDSCLKKTLVNPHWRESIFLWNLWISICYNFLFEETHRNTHRKEIFFLIDGLIYFMTRDYAVVFIVIFYSCYSWVFYCLHTVLLNMNEF